MTHQEAGRLGGKSKSIKKLKAVCKNLRNGRLSFHKKYPGKCINDFHPRYRT